MKVLHLAAICFPTSCICSSKLTCLGPRLCRLSSSSLIKSILPKLLSFQETHLGSTKKWYFALGNLSLITTTEGVENTTNSGFFMSDLKPLDQLDLTWGWGGSGFWVEFSVWLLSSSFCPFLSPPPPIKRNLEGQKLHIICIISLNICNDSAKISFSNLCLPSNKSRHCPTFSRQNLPLCNTWLFSACYFCDIWSF